MFTYSMLTKIFFIFDNFYGKLRSPRYADSNSGGITQFAPKSVGISSILFLSSLWNAAPWNLKRRAPGAQRKNTNHSDTRTPETKRVRVTTHTTARGTPTTHQTTFQPTTSTHRHPVSVVHASSTTYLHRVKSLDPTESCSLQLSPCSTPHSSCEQPQHTTHQQCLSTIFIHSNTM